MSYDPFRSYFDFDSLFKTNVAPTKMVDSLMPHKSLAPINDELTIDSYREPFTSSMSQFSSARFSSTSLPPTTANRKTIYGDIQQPSQFYSVPSFLPYHGDIARPKTSPDSAQSLAQNEDNEDIIELGLLNPYHRINMDEKFCALCKRNGEAREFYITHVLKDNRGKVVCPILRKYSCPKCGATGDNAHTLKHCPITKASKQRYTS